MDKHYYLYFMTNSNNTVVYAGVTSNLSRRVGEHREKAAKNPAAQYNITKLVYYEVFDDPVSALRREKKVKTDSREKKILLIESVNPAWKDLSESL